MVPPVYRRRHVLKLFGTVAAASVLVTACGGGGNAPAPGATSAPQAAAPTQAPAQAAAPTAAPTTAAQAPAATPTTAAQQAGAPTPTPNPLASVPIKSGKKVIEWWFGWGGMTALQSFAALGKDFNDTHDDFQVKPLQVSSITQKLLAAIAGGNPPAVETGNITFAQFWVTGAARDLTDKLKGSTTIKLSDLFDPSVKAGQWKGKQYGIPAIEGYLRWGLCFNKSFLDQKGIKENELPNDFDSLYKFAKDTTVVESSGAIKTLGIDMLDAMGGSFGDGDPFYWPAAWGFKYWDDTALKYNFDNPQMVETFAMVQKFYDIANADKIAGFHKSYGTWTESPTAMFPTGVEAANINGYWAPGELAKSATGKHFLYTWVPTAQKGVKLQSTGGHYAMEPQGSPEPDLGWQLIEYLDGPKATQIIFDGTGWIGANKAFASKLDIKKYEGLDWWVGSADSATVMWQVYVDPIQAFVSDQWSKIQESVNFHKTTPAEAAQQLQKAADTEMKNQFPNGL